MRYIEIYVKYVFSKLLIYISSFLLLVLCTSLKTLHGTVGTALIQRGTYFTPV